MKDDPQIPFIRQMKTGFTGEICTVSGIYKSDCAHSIQRALPLGHTFPPCDYCRHEVVWIYVRTFQSK